MRAAIVVVLITTSLEWLGWATIDHFTLLRQQMTPWSAFCLAWLAVAVLLHISPGSRGRARVGVGIAAAVGILMMAFLAEYATGRSFGLDLIWFDQPVQVMYKEWPGRPTQRVAAALLLLSAAIPMTHGDRRWVRICWPWLLAGAAAAPLMTLMATLFGVMSLMGTARTIGQGFTAPAGILVLVAATLMLRPDRNPVAWLRARPDRGALLRLVGILAGLPVFVAAWRFGLMKSGVPDDAAWTLAVMVGAAIVGATAFYVSQHEQKMILDREQLTRERIEAQTRYRILADNAVDIIVHLRDGKVVWISPSVQAACGDSPSNWIGTEFEQRVHPDDLDIVFTKLNRIAPGEPVIARFRLSTVEGDYHWVEGHANPCIGGDGKADGLIAALRVVDDQVEAERKLQRLARYDMLTGLVNRREALTRFDALLKEARLDGRHLGILFCDVDHFKTINDSWGHAVGDVVLATLATRINECVRGADTVGRTGGDEMLVLLPDIHSLDGAADIAERIRIRAAEPIHASGLTVYATLSIGATVAAPDETVVTMLARADAAMYRAKNAGRNTVTRI